MLIKNPIIKLIYLFILFVVISCASEVAVTGGPMDNTPPEMIEAIPTNGSVNFNEKSIYIKFNEYIKLNNVNQKLIISPPISEKPNVFVKGKGIKINLNPTLLEPNTTYSFNFNDAIADNNENNELHSFVYAFSTGDYIDSLTFSGYVLDAFTREPIEDAWVILHNDLSDSSINSLNPRYLTKVDKEGKFLIPFVAENDYKIFALKDGNFNYKYDLPTERIAFIDSIFRPGIEKIPVVDTIDSLSTQYFNYRNFPNNIELLLFSENKQAQFIKSHKRLTNNHLELVFNSPQYESFSIKVDEDPNSIVYAKHNPDTVNVWLSNKDLISTDSLKIYLTYTDPIYTDSVKTDTLRFRKGEKEEKDTIIPIIAKLGEMPYKNFQINTTSPIIDFDSTKIKIELKADTIFSNINFTIKRDSLNPLNLITEAKIEDKSDYRIIVDENFILSINGFTNKTDTINLSTISAKELSNLIVNFANSDKNYIVELLQNDKVVNTLFSVDGKVEFKYIQPGKYFIRTIEDINKNLRWDTGDYSIKKQPEPVYYYPSEYEVRTRWNHTIDWDPKVNIFSGNNTE